MARRFFGDRTIDLHGGGIDLKFPHHENEIAQSEGVLNNYNSVSNQEHVAFCNCWFHNGFVNIGDEKMSKSLGNFLTLRTACPTALEVRAYRYLVVSSQYRNDLPFTPAVLKASQKTLKRMDKLVLQLDGALTNFKAPNDGESSSILADEEVPKMVENFESALLDDMNMPRAAASFIGVIKLGEQELKKSLINGKEQKDLDLVGLAAVRTALDKMDQVFGIFYDVPLTEVEMEASYQEDEVPEEVLELVSQRSAAKDAKDWELADSLRSRISELGFAVKDVKDGEPIISRL
jgi:cysteinyl-tRNA synthetase